MEPLQKFLPSRKFLYAVTAIIIVFGAIMFASYLAKKTSGEVALDNGGGALQAFQAANDLDTDLDGLKDWEEALWKTDPKNKDTDGDGTADSEEITQKRNPLVSGPNDALTDEELRLVKAAEKLNPIPSKTDQFSREIFAQILALKESGTLNKKTTAELSQTIADQFSSEETPLFTLADLKISKEKSVPALRAYGNALAVTLAEFSSYTIPNELEIVLEALQQNDKNVLIALDANITIYNDLIDKHKRISVPQEIAELHLALLNEYELSTYGVARMKTVFDDPLGGMIGVKMYRDHAALISDALVAIERYMKTMGVTFEKSEPGYVFTK